MQGSTSLSVAWAVVTWIITSMMTSLSHLLMTYIRHHYCPFHYRPAVYVILSPSVINRCDLSERITHEPSLIWSLFPSDAGDSSGSHIHWPWSLVGALSKPAAQGCIQSVCCFSTLASLDPLSPPSPSWKLTPECKGCSERWRGSAGSGGSDRVIKNKGEG